MKITSSYSWTVFLISSANKPSLVNYESLPQPPLIQVTLAAMVLLVNNDWVSLCFSGESHG